MRMRDRFIKFMYGRYGVDEFGKSMLWFAVILSVIGMILNLFNLGVWIAFSCSTISTILMIYIIYRAFSRNINKRVHENHKYLSKTSKIRTYFRFCKTRFNDRKHFLYVKCPNCKNYSRVPKGKGRIKITCRVCKKQFERKV